MKKKKNKIKSGIMSIFVKKIFRRFGTSFLKGMESYNEKKFSLYRSLFQRVGFGFLILNNWVFLNVKNTKFKQTKRRWVLTRVKVYNLVVSWSNLISLYLEFFEILSSRLKLTFIISQLLRFWKLPQKW